MSSPAEFVTGLMAKAPQEGAPSFIKARLSIKRLELIAWLQTREGDWINADVKESRGGKWYVAVDDWKPKEGGGRIPQAGPADEFVDDDIPY